MATMHDYRRSSVGDIGTVPSTGDMRDIGEHQADFTLLACFDAMLHVWGDVRSVPGYERRTKP
jgi:hypothetical protein